MYLIAGAIIVPLEQDKEGLYRDHLGTIFALRDDSSTLDLIDRCGIAPLVLPGWASWMRRLNKACGYHDYIYSSPAYQAFHTRREADAALEAYILKMSQGRWWGKLARPFRNIAARFGAKAWENERTR